MSDPESLEGPGERGARWPSALLVTLMVVWSLALSLWFASERLNAGRFWDERFSVWNIRSVLETNSLRPDNGFYQSLSYLPQAGLLAISETIHSVTGHEAFNVYGNAGDLSPNAYFVCRAVQALYGAGCLIFVFLLGRRLFSPGVGLLAALILLGAPWHVHASAIFKPDILVALTTLVALLWSVRAAESPPDWRRYALAGFGIALAPSAKLTGGVIALPLVVATLLTGWRDRRRIIGLAVAGVTSLLSFLALNPYFQMYFTFLERNLSVYAYRAESYAGTKAAVLWRELEMIVAWNSHGAIIGVTALVAVAVLAASVLRPATAADVRLRWAMFLTFPIAYSLAYAATTAHFLEQNFLPILPFTALAAAWLLASIWSWAQARWPKLDRRWVAVSLAVMLAVVFVPRPFFYVYESLVPTTQDVAMRMLRARFAETLDGGAGRLVIAESWQTSRIKWEDAQRFGSSRLAIRAVDRLDGLPAVTIDHADGEIFLAERLDGEAAAFYFDRVARFGEANLERVSAKPFKARGEPVVAVFRPWKPTAPASEIAVPVRGESIPVDPGVVVSLALRMPNDFRDVGPPTLTVGDRELRWYWTSTPEPVRLFVTERVVLDAGQAIRRGADELEPEPIDQMRLELIRWSDSTS